MEKSSKEQKAVRASEMGKRLVLAAKIAETIILEADDDDEILIVFNLVCGLLFCGSVRVVN